MKGLILLLVLIVVPRFTSTSLEATSVGEIVALSYVFWDIIVNSIWKVSTKTSYAIKGIVLYSLYFLTVLMASSIFSTANGSNLVISIAILARIVAFFYILSNVQTIRIGQIPFLKKSLAVFSVVGLIVMIVNLFSGIKSGSYGLGLYSVSAANLSGYIANALLSSYLLLKIRESLSRGNVNCRYDKLDIIFFVSAISISILTLSRTSLLVSLFTMLFMLPSILSCISGRVHRVFMTLKLNKYFLLFSIASSTVIIVFSSVPATAPLIDLLQKMIGRFANLNITLTDYGTFYDGISSTGRILNKLPYINSLIGGFNIVEIFFGRGLGYSVSWSKSIEFGGLDSQIYALFIDIGFVGLGIFFLCLVAISLSVLHDLLRLNSKGKGLYLLFISTLFNFCFLFTNEFLYLLPSYSVAGFSIGLFLWLKKEVAILQPCMTSHESH